MNFLITEKRYPKPVDLYEMNSGRNRPIYDVCNFPNGCIILYEQEYLKGYFHFEAWINYDIKDLHRLSIKKNVFYTSKFLSSIKTFESVTNANIYNFKKEKHEIQEELIYIESNKTILFKIQNLKIVEFEFKKHLQIINSDLKLKVNKKMHF